MQQSLKIDVVSGPGLFSVSILYRGRAVRRTLLGGVFWLLSSIAERSDMPQSSTCLSTLSTRD